VSKCNETIIGYVRRARPETMPNAQSLRWFEPWPNRERDAQGNLVSRPADDDGDLTLWP
jgi:hypothetical protein